RLPLSATLFPYTTLFRSKSGVRVCRSDHAELVRIHAKFLFKLQPIPQRRTRVLELQHLGLLEYAKIQVAFVPALEIREFIVGRRSEEHTSELQSRENLVC